MIFYGEKEKLLRYRIKIVQREITQVNSYILLVLLSILQQQT